MCFYHLNIRMCSIFMLFWSPQFLLLNVKVTKKKVHAYITPGLALGILLIVRITSIILHPVFVQNLETNPRNTAMDS